MPRAAPLVALASLAPAALAACGGPDPLPLQAGFGPNPVLPPPQPAMVSTVNIAPAVGWANGQQPHAAAGFAVEAFADGLDHPRWLYVLPNGDVLVAETNAPPKEADGPQGLGRCSRSMKEAGAGVSSANRITLLRDADGDGSPEIRTVFLAGAASRPSAWPWSANDFYVANTDAVLALPLRAGPDRDHRARAPRSPTCRPARSTTTGPRTSSPAPTARSSMSPSAPTATSPRTAWRPRSAAPPSSRSTAPRASRASSPPACAIRSAWTGEPQSGALWTAVNERDELGDDLVPDYMTSVQDGGFYGWPYSYYGQHVDARVEPAAARPRGQGHRRPTTRWAPHTASLGLAFYDGDAFPERYRGGAFVGQHGSWNRSAAQRLQGDLRAVPRRAPRRQPEDVLTGFLAENGDALGPPGRRGGRPGRRRCWWRTTSATSSGG